MMKKILSTITILMFFLTLSVNAQMTAPSDPGGSPGVDDDPIGGGAPIGGGSLILLGMAAIYGGKKIYDLRKDMEELED
ncbi:MAG: hypothetical protein GXO88_03240 [Chlorobi bacterium]|nr:hypothetical protein [Chlorobiota bacterium]